MSAIGCHQIPGLPTLKSVVEFDSYGGVLIAILLTYVLAFYWLPRSSGARQSSSSYRSPRS